jgi:hypothetical protein
MIKAGHSYKICNDYISRTNQMFPLYFMKLVNEPFRPMNQGEIFLVVSVPNAKNATNWHLVKILDQYSNVGSIWHWSDPPLQLNPGIKLVC